MAHSMGLAAASASLSVNGSQAINTNTHSDHVFLVLPCPLAPFVTDLIQDVARCACSYHLSRRLRRTAVISIGLSFCGTEAGGVSSQSLVPQIQWIIARSLQWS